MNENMFDINYDVTKKSKLRKFYEEKKIFIYTTIIILLISIFSITFYEDIKIKKKNELSSRYVQAKIYIDNGEEYKAASILKDIIFENDPTYSSLSLFLIINQNLIKDNIEITRLFDHILKNNKFKKEIKNLLIYKKAVFNSNYVSELEMLRDIKPLLNEKTLWKPHALYLIGNYYINKNEHNKAKEFFAEILSIPNLQNEFYDQAKNQLLVISSE
jgi:hypothetical protein